MVTHQKFGLHHDSVALDDENKVLPIQEENPRAITLFLYINTVKEGGKTIFPELIPGIQYSVSPIAGNAIMFPNIYLSEKGIQPLQETIHEAEPVPPGQKKMGVNIWIYAK